MYQCLSALKILRNVLIVYLFNYFVDGRKWWRLTTDVEDVSSGLSPLITFTSLSKSVGMMDSTGKIQILSGRLDTINTAPHAVWGISGSHMYHVGKAQLSLYFIFTVDIRP